MCFSIDPAYYLDRAIDINPDHFSATLLRAEILIDQGCATAAISLVNTYLSKNGDQPELLNFLANHYLTEGQIDAAESYNNKALIKKPRSYESLYTGFLIKKTQGDKFSAIHFLERIMRDDDHSFDVYWQMSQLLDEPEELTKKVTLLEIAFSMNARGEIFLQLINGYLDLIASDHSKQNSTTYCVQLSEYISNPQFKDLPKSTQQRAYSLTAVLKQ